MRLSLSFVLGLVGAAFAQSNVTSYISIETPLAKAGVLANIGPDGSLSSGAKVCCVLLRSAALMLITPGASRALSSLALALSTPTTSTLGPETRLSRLRRSSTSSLAARTTRLVALSTTSLPPRRSFSRSTTPVVP